MKRTLTCPKCGSVDLYYVAKVAEGFRNCDVKGADLAVIARKTPGVFGTELVHHESTGQLEAYACQRCGYIEHYLKEPLEVDGTLVQAIRGPRQ
jgi:predicted nucleic-acid-binding Zn-ribbon protein